MSVHRPTPRPVHLIAAGVVVLCGGPVIALFVGLSLHGLARLAGWVA